MSTTLYLYASRSLASLSPRLLFKYPAYKIRHARAIRRRAMNDRLRLQIYLSLISPHRE